MSSKNKPKTNKKYIFAVGRRRRCTVSLKLFVGKGENLVNNHPAQEYFPTAIAYKKLLAPLILFDLEKKYYFTAHLSGGGKIGQLEATVLALARALNKQNESVYRPRLKKAGFLSVDSRRRQRRQAGMGGKSRRQKQSPKR